MCIKKKKSCSGDAATAGATAFHSLSHYFLTASSIASKGCLACFRHSNNSQTKPNQLWNITYKNSSVTIKKKPRLPAPKAPAILPLTALPALQVVESGVTSAAVPAGHVGQTLALPGHGVTAALLLHCPVGVAVTGYGRKTCSLNFW